MKRVSALLAVVALTVFGTATAGKPAWATSPDAAAICQAGLHGDHPAGLDQDGDTVPDSEDWCSRTPAGQRVGANGCGVADIQVVCDRGLPEPRPRVVPAANVGKQSRDTDGDGVEDEDDKCPGTPRKAEVNDDGCVKIEKVVLRGVNFATGSAKLLPAAHETLRAIAGAMKANKDLEIEVGGHTDSVGDEAKNEKLSERRAKAVKDFLVGEGIDEGRLSTKGYGEGSPTDTNDTAEGRANNRRVAFKITDS